MHEALACCIFFDCKFTTIINNVQGFVKKMSVFSSVCVKFWHEARKWDR